MDEGRRVAGAGGSKLYVGAGTYSVAAGTLNKGTTSIYIRADQAAMITSAKTTDYNIAAVAITGAPIGSDLLLGDFFTFKNPLSEIVIAGGSFIGYQS